MPRTGAGSAGSMPTSEAVESRAVGERLSKHAFECQMWCRCPSRLRLKIATEGVSHRRFSIRWSIIVITAESSFVLPIPNIDGVGQRGGFRCDSTEEASGLCANGGGGWRLEERCHEQRHPFSKLF